MPVVPNQPNKSGLVPSILLSVATVAALGDSSKLDAIGASKTNPPPPSVTNKNHGSGTLPIPGNTPPEQGRNSVLRPIPLPTNGAPIAPLTSEQRLRELGKLGEALSGVEDVGPTMGGRVQTNTPPSMVNVDKIIKSARERLDFSPHLWIWSDKGLAQQVEEKKISPAEGIVAGRVQLQLASFEIKSSGAVADPPIASALVILARFKPGSTDESGVSKLLKEAAKALQ